MRNWYMETRYRCDDCKAVSKGSSLLGVDPDRLRRGLVSGFAYLSPRPSCPFDDGEVRAIMVQVFLRDASGRFRSVAATQ